MITIYDTSTAQVKYSLQKLLTATEDPFFPAPPKSILLIVAGRDIKLTMVAKISGIHRNGMKPNIGQLQKLVPKIRIELFVDKH